MRQWIGLAEKIGKVGCLARMVALEVGWGLQRRRPGGRLRRWAIEMGGEDREEYRITSSAGGGGLTSTGQ
jgi:hypothetical protein